MELESLRRELSKLKSEKAAFQTQSKLLENFVAMARSPTEGQMLKATLQKTLEVCTELTSAEKGSLFLVDSDGVVTDCILSRSHTTPEESSRLIGSVLEKGFAGWVSRNRQVGLITDTQDDDRWLTLPNEPYTVRSALAVPILRGEELLGVLTLMHSQPGLFSSETAELMEATSDQIALTLENARLYSKLDESYRSLGKAKQEVEAYSKALDHELEKGRQIQRDFLPSQIPQPPNWEIATCFFPALQVSGDFYDAFWLPDDCVGLVIADVCDKGVGSALYMALLRSLIRVFSGESSLEALPNSAVNEEMQATTDVDQIDALKAVALTNDYIAQEHGEEGMFATLFFGVLNPKTGLLVYVNGGHEPPFVVGTAGFKQRLEPTGPAVGVLPHITFKIKQVQLEPGDTLLGYTDGVSEARSPGDELFTKKRLESLLDQPACSASDLLERIKTSLFVHIDNAQQFDDITMIAVYRAPITPR
jgi:sigma-B regulation protein RsbU (phosphoserine phosphatase)